MIPDIDTRAVTFTLLLKETTVFLATKYPDAGSHILEERAQNSESI
jgi:hypothetical protein